MKVKNCCCCFPLESGCIVLGVLGCLLSLLCLSFELGFSVGRQVSLSASVVALLAFSLASNLALLLGAHFQRPVLLQVHLVLRVVWILLMLLGALGLSLVALEVDGAAGAVEEGERQLAPAAAAAAAAVCIVEAGASTYFWLVAYFYRQQLVRTSSSSTAATHEMEASATNNASAI